MQEAFIENAENDVDGGERGTDQNPFLDEHLLEDFGGSGEAGMDRSRHVDFGGCPLDRLHGSRRDLAPTPSEPEERFL